MNKRLAAAGIGAGAGLMYLLDPERGRRRRALLRDQMIHAAHKTGDAVDATVRDLLNRTRGFLASTQSRLSADEPTDDVLVARVRAKLGTTVDHPGAIEVAASNGRVTLSGPILAEEVDRLLATVAAVRGVTAVENALEVHETPGDVPGLQDGASRKGERFELLQTYWSPTARLLTSVAGGGLALYGAARRDLVGAGVGALGLGLLARGVTNLPPSRLLGVRAGRRAIDIHKTINVEAPVEEAFAFWSHYENFPRFMSHVREVRETSPGRSHWVVGGVAGAPLEWDAVITRYEPNRALAWKTEPGAAIAHAGVVRFDPNPDGSTRLDVQLSYNPPTGAVGHAVAALFGSDPKQMMDEDLVRLKSLIEHGKTSAHGQEVTPHALGAQQEGRSDA